MSGVLQCFDGLRNTNVPSLDQILRWCVRMPACTLKIQHIFYIGLSWTLVWMLKGFLRWRSINFLYFTCYVHYDNFTGNFWKTKKWNHSHHHGSLLLTMWYQRWRYWRAESFLSHLAMSVGFSQNLPSVNSKDVGYSGWYEGMCWALSGLECVYRSTQSFLFDGGAWKNIRYLIWDSEGGWIWGRLGHLRHSGATDLD